MPLRGSTVTIGLVPVITLETESVAVIDWLPAVLKTTLLNACDPASPATKAYVGGRPASWTSVLLRSTVPMYGLEPFSTLPKRSCDVTVTVPEVPATSGLAKVVDTMKS